MIQNPTKTFTVLVVSAWLVGSIAMFTVGTDYFQKSFLQKQNILFGAIFLYATIRAVVVLRNYLKARRKMG